MFREMDLERLVAGLTREILARLKTERPKALIMAAGREVPDLQPFSCLDGYRLLNLDDAWQDENIQRRIVPCLSIRQMSELAQGRANGRVSMAILSEVLQGRVVEVLAYEYQRYADTAPPALLALYAAQAETLAGFGIKPFASTVAGEAPFSGKLLTEAGLREFAATGRSCIRLDRACRVTPLALDFARDNQITISWEEADK